MTIHNKQGLILIMIFLYSCNQIFAQKLPVMASEVSTHNGITYYQGSPFSGIVFDKAPNGKKILDANYSNGNLNGPYIEWHDNGKKKSEVFYVNGKIDNGIYYTYDREGNKLSAITYSNHIKIKEEKYKYGKLNGITTEWYENGELKSETFYKNGIKDGMSRSYNYLGKVTEETYNVAGTTGKTTKYEYYDNGNPRLKSEYENNIQHGITTEWYEGGEKKREAKYERGKEIEVLFENKNDPSKSIKNFVRNNRECILGTFWHFAPNMYKLDHVNVEIRYELGNFSESQEIKNNINNTIFRYRVKHTDRSSDEQLHGRIIIKNCTWELYWDTQQNFLEGILGTKPGYRCKLTVELLEESFVTENKSTHTITYISPKYQTKPEAFNMAKSQIGYKVADKLYELAPLAVGVQSIAELKKNGFAKTVKVNGGAQAGLYRKLELRVFDVSPDTGGGMIIGKIKVEVDGSGDMAICEVKDGEEKITELLNQGKILKAIAP
jgi:antitoxin component YwqK of YwqJK toxin-antitoxin module